MIERVRWNGPAGHLSELAGYDVRATVRKHKRAAPVGDALVRCDTFEDRPPLVDTATRSVQAERSSLDPAQRDLRSGRAVV